MSPAGVFGPVRFRAGARSQQGTLTERGGEKIMQPLFEQYRPSSWREVVGQDAALKQVHRVGCRGYAGRAWWLCGPAGTGKTTLARLIAAEVASDWHIHELDASEATPAALREIETSMATYGMGKGGKERYCPFGQKVAKALLKYQLRHRPKAIGNDSFFLGKEGHPLTANRVEKIIRDYGKRAGLGAYPHKFRHTSSVMYLRNGGDPFSLQKKLGHSSLQMTRHYSNLADSDVREKQHRVT